MRRRYGGRNKFARKLNANKMDKATVIESQELTVVPEGGNYVQHNLIQFNRALAVSKNYRFYRCKKVELEFIPYANVFAQGQAFPELYFQVDRTQGILGGINLPLPTKNMMLARGCTPIKWTSIVKRSYTPNVLRNENFVYNTLGGNQQDFAGIASTPVLYKWYTTQSYYAPGTGGNAVHTIHPSWGPQFLQYFGAVYYVDQPIAPAGAVLGTIKMKVHWEFKQPLWTTDTQAPAPEQQ